VLLGDVMKYSCVYLSGLVCSSTDLNILSIDISSNSHNPSIPIYIYIYVCVINVNE
jgi:hypothetical protein